MPNTPSQIGAGMSVWTASSGVPGSAVQATRRILEPLGEELYVEDEKFIDMATALSASGPAYVFLFIEALIDAGVYLGMPRDMASQLALQTVAGSTQLVRESGRHPAELKDMVTSPGGTTAEALLTLEQGAFKGVVIEAVAAAYEKSKGAGRIAGWIFSHRFIQILVWALTIAVVGRALMSFISPQGSDPVSAVLIQITEPILAPIRQFLPQTTLDFSPIIAIVVLQLIGRVLLSIG